jgi:hypothetical protein
MQIPSSWTAAVLAIRAVCPTAVLAGGALRDLDNDRPIKDFDVFIAADDLEAAEDAMASLTEAGLTVAFDPTELTVYPEDQNLEVVAVAEIQMPEALKPFAGIRALPVQAVFVRWDTAQIVDRFDYGICRLSYDGSGTTVLPPLEYTDDKANKVFRLRRERLTPLSMRGSVKRYARLTAEKYPGWDWQAFEAPCEFLLP